MCKMGGTDKIIPLLGIYESNQYVLLVMPFFETDVFSYVRNRRYLSEVDSRNIFIQMLTSVHHMHTQGYVHRDIKFDNFLIDSEKNVYLIDFGNADQIDEDNLFTTTCGSLAYCSPSIIQGVPYDGRQADIWALGVCLYAMNVGLFPFYTMKSEIETRNRILNNKLKLPQRFSAGLKNLLCRLLSRNLDKRISMEEIISHPWVRSKRRRVTA
eukprot:TRINITY_DN2256_c0_g1_i1.p1 TRINITY_DN2256_c0_g1~~TRINITY_DN2256_c0_g1_i1.p1  ORF type:complete len:212 (-),score=32.97 TRINITY_DN2256_c0_g1_i1:100-735(-)